MCPDDNRLIDQLRLLNLDNNYINRSQKVSICGDTSDPVTLHTSFSQRSVFVQFQYPTYTAPSFCVTKAHMVSIHTYAVDTYLYASFNLINYADCIANMQQCTTDIHQWMSKNHLKLNTNEY